MFCESRLCFKPKIKNDDNDNEDIFSYGIHKIKKIEFTKWEEDIPSKIHSEAEEKQIFWPN